MSKVKWQEELQVVFQGGTYPVIYDGVRKTDTEFKHCLTILFSSYIRGFDYADDDGLLEIRGNAPHYDEDGVRIENKGVYVTNLSPPNKFKGRYYAKRYFK